MHCQPEGTLSFRAKRAARSRGIAIVPVEGSLRHEGAGSLRRAAWFHGEARRNAEAQRTLKVRGAENGWMPIPNILSGRVDEE